MQTKALKQDGPDTLVSLRIQPRASKSSIEGDYGEQIKIRLNAPPVDGKANKALLVFLAKTLALKRGQLEIESGARSRDKVVRVRDVDIHDLADRLAAASSA
jgi:uncharacterized protein (TIGR00251 family)